MLPMRLRLFACLLLPFMAVSGAAPAHASPTPPRSPLVTQHDCFSGKFASYDRWMAFLRGKNNLFIATALRWKFPEDEFTRYRNALDCRYITYRSDGHLVEAWLVQPRHRTAGKRPVIVYNRGGNRDFGALTFAHLFMHVFPLAEQGFVVAASQYRGAGSDAQTPSPDQYGGDDVHDVTNLLRLVVRLPQADAGNVYMIGQSRGAIMTFRALLDTPVPVRAVAIWSGAYDLHDLLRFRPEFAGLFAEVIPGYARHARDELDRRSVTHWPARLPARTGVLMIHGDADENAPVSSARAFARELDALHRPHKAIFYPGESHFLDGHTDEVHAETLAWFRRFRAGAAPAATPSPPLRTVAHALEPAPLAGAVP